MRKEEQIKINNEVENVMNDVFEATRVCDVTWERLRTCKAAVATCGCYRILLSYNTIVACIDTSDDTLYDFLRKVYGYTSTSAQHISKFEKDYCAGKWNCAERLTWREV